MVVLGRLGHHILIGNLHTINHLMFSGIRNERSALLERSLLCTTPQPSDPKKLYAGSAEFVFDISRSWIVLDYSRADNPR